MSSSSNSGEPHQTAIGFVVEDQYKDSPQHDSSTSKDEYQDLSLPPHTRPLRHDEQTCEAHYDERDDADDDIEKGKIRFPKHALYGREKESRQLEDFLAASIEQKRFNIAFLKGHSGTGKSALVRESLLFEHSSSFADHGRTPQKRKQRHRSCWIAFGKYNDNAASQPFSAIMSALEQLGNSIVREATTALNDTVYNGTTQDNSIIALSHRLSSWYDTDDASTLMGLCPSLEVMHLTLKKIHRQTQRCARLNHSHHRLSSTSWHKENQSSLSIRRPSLERAATNETNLGGREVSETSSIMSEDNSSSAEQGSDVASSDIQQLALSLLTFLQHLTTTSRPLIWFLDDLQWADACSIQLIHHLLTVSIASTFATTETKEDISDLWDSVPTKFVDVDTIEDRRGSGSVTINPLVGLFVGAYRPISESDETTSPDAALETPSAVNFENESPRAVSHDLTTLQGLLDNIIKSAESATSSSERNDFFLLQLEVTNLPPKAILEFCCATLDISEEEAWPLTNALYSATMGNIFHCQQALEHLVRINCLYYDVMFFSWTYNLPDDGSVLEDVIKQSCQDVSALVWSKLEACNELVRATLIRAAYTENTVLGAILLLSLLRATGYPNLSEGELRKTLDEICSEGLFLNITWGVASTDYSNDDGGQHPFRTLQYKFSHDKVKEASHKLLPESGPERDRVLLPFSIVLIQWATQLIPTSFSADSQPSDSGLMTVPYSIAKRTSTYETREWMWFVGLQHLNTIPVENIIGTSYQISTHIGQQPVLVDRTLLAQWNMRVAEMSVTHGSFSQAIVYLKAAISYLDVDDVWPLDGSVYQLLLQLHNKLMEISLAQGQFGETKGAIAVVLTKAHSLVDKITAFHTKVQLAVEMNDRNVEFGIMESLNILKIFGMKFSSHAIDACLEKAKFKMELHGRPISVLGELDLIPLDDPKGDMMKLLTQLAHLILLNKNEQQASLMDMVASRGMRWTLENGISRHFALLLSEYGTPLRSRGKTNAAGRYALIVKRLFQRFAEEGGAGTIRASDFLFCEFILHAGMLPLQDHPFVESLEKFIDIYRHALASGSVECAMSSAMHYPLTYYICGRPLNALLDAKLALFQQKALQLRQDGFAALFHCARQVQQNLQGIAVGPNKVIHTTFIQDQEQILLKLEGHNKDMTTRDFAIYQMMLAVIFGDVVCMEIFMNQLKGVPLFDLSFARQLLRCTYCGIAAYILARDGRDSKKNLKIATDIVKELKKLDGAEAFSKETGSVNYRPIVLCLAAVERNKVEDYDLAITACSRGKLLQLKALMCEFAGLLCIEQSNSGLKQPSGSVSKLRFKTTLKRNPQTSRHSSHDDSDCKPTMKGDLLELGQHFLGKAMWSYQDWNALGKVSQLKQQFPILQSLTRRAAGIKSSSSSVGSLRSTESTSRSQGRRPSTYFPIDNQLGCSSESESFHTTESG